MKTFLEFATGNPSDTPSNHGNPTSVYQKDYLGAENSLVPGKFNGTLNLGNSRLILTGQNLQIFLSNGRSISLPLTAQQIQQLFSEVK